MGDKRRIQTPPSFVCLSVCLLYTPPLGPCTRTDNGNGEVRRLLFVVSIPPKENGNFLSTPKIVTSFTMRKSDLKQVGHQPYRPRATQPNQPGEGGGANAASEPKRTEQDPTTPA